MCGAVVRDHKTTPPAPVRGVPRICCLAQQESVGRKLIMNEGRRRTMIIQGHRALAEAPRRGHDRYRNLEDRMTATGTHRLCAVEAHVRGPCPMPSTAWGKTRASWLRTDGAAAGISDPAALGRDDQL